MVKEASAGIIVFHRAPYIEFLILHYAEGHHDLPKGHIELDESPEQAAVRETREETGLDVKIMPGFREEIEYSFKDRIKGIIRKRVIFFIAESKCKDIILSDEHQGFAWLKIDAALNKVTFDTARTLLKKAESFLISSH